VSRRKPAPRRKRSSSNTKVDSPLPLPVNEENELNDEVVLEVDEVVPEVVTDPPEVPPVALPEVETPNDKPPSPSTTTRPSPPWEHKRPPTSHARAQYPSRVRACHIVVFPPVKSVSVSPVAGWKTYICAGTPIRDIAQNMLPPSIVWSCKL